MQKFTHTHTTSLHWKAKWEDRGLKDKNTKIGGQWVTCAGRPDTESSCIHTPAVCLNWVPNGNLFSVVHALVKRRAPYIGNKDENKVSFLGDFTLSVIIAYIHNSDSSTHNWTRYDQTTWYISEMSSKNKVGRSWSVIKAHWVDNQSRQRVDQTGIRSTRV